MIGACAALPNRDAEPFGAVPTGAALVGCSGRVACEHGVERCVYEKIVSGIHCRSMVWFHASGIIHAESMNMQPSTAAQLQYS